MKWQKLMFVSMWWVNRGNKFNVWTFWIDLLILVIPISFILALLIDFYVS